VVTEAIRCATIVVIPSRPGVFDIDAVKETIEFTRALHKPYAVVMNSAPARRANRDSSVVTQARQSLAAINAPVWGGQISYRTNYGLALAEGEDADEYDHSSLAAIEIGTLWYAIEQSVRAITEMNGTARAAARPNAA
jgi:cellulose biosynthesis protein BcsQ